MDEFENDTYLSADTCLADPKDDQLGYSSFAKNISKEIIRMAPSEGFVIAIYGKWGSGKSTLINFITYYFNEMPENEQPIIFRFNPWWFSGNEDLIRNFFSQLQIVLNKKGIFIGDLAKLIADFSDAIADTPLPYASSGRALARIIRPKMKEVAELKEKISDLLSHSEKKILIVIDDIDRLTSEEIRQIFRLVKAVADFPNTIYLLSFDRSVVSSALSETEELVGENYIEKIVQLPFELPVPEKTLFRSMFFRKLNALLGDISEVFIDQRYWSNLYFTGIDYLISTPRDINRLINTLSITYPVVKGEVNPYDFIAIEALRLTYPELYDSIRKQEEMFIGTISESGVFTPTLDDHEKFHRNLLDQIRDGQRKKCIQNILTTLFPKLHKVYKPTAYGYSESHCRKRLHICSPEIFPRYFRLAIPVGDISVAEMMAILSHLEDREVFAERLVELSKQKVPDGSTRIHIFLERIKDYIDENIDSKKAQCLIYSLMDIGDKLIRPEDELHSNMHTKFYDLPNDSLMRFRVLDLLKQLANGERLNTLELAFRDGKAITMAVEILRSLGKEYGKYDSNDVVPDGHRTISEDDLKILEIILLKKIRTAAEDQSLIKAPHLPLVLHSWQQLGESKDKIQGWMKKTVRSDDGLISILESFLIKSDTNLGIRYSFDPNNLKPFIEPFELIDRTREILKRNHSLTEIQKTAMIEFINGCENRNQAKID